MYCKQPGQENEIDKYLPAAPREAIQLIGRGTIASLQPPGDIIQIDDVLILQKVFVVEAEESPSILTKQLTGHEISFIKTFLQSLVYGY